MLQSAHKFQGFKLLTEEGEIGKFHEFYFDDKIWLVRYVVVDMGGGKTPISNTSRVITR